MEKNFIEMEDCFQALDYLETYERNGGVSIKEETKNKFIPVVF
jgi:hypothetical protein